MPTPLARRSAALLAAAALALSGPVTAAPSQPDFHRSGGAPGGPATLETDPDAPPRQTLLAGGGPRLAALPGIRAFAVAGDVNGDGYSDVLVGVPGNNEVVVFGGDSAGILNFQTLLGSAQVGSEFGAAVSAAGDVNGDGFDDVLVGEPLWRNGALQVVGRVSVFHGSAGGVATTPALQIEGTLPGGRFGAALARLGNANGDAYDDVAIAAPLASAPGMPAESGVIHVHYGSSGGLLPGGVVLLGKHLGERRGSALAGIGDADGDGDDDLVAGGPYRVTDLQQGRIYLYRGTGGGMATEPSDSVSTGGVAGLFGAAVAPAGDWNGDGYADVVAGAPLADAFGPVADAGAAFLLLGSASGLTASTVHQGTLAGGRLGEAVGCAGDWNGDGFGDYAIGEPGYDGTIGADEGRVIVSFGRRADNNLPLPDAVISSQAAGSQTGFLVSGLGDLGADGFPELGYGEIFGSDGSLNIRRGGIALAARTSTVSNGASNLAGGPPPLRMGAAVASGGDFNGDGLDDVLLGAPRDDASVPNEGVAYWVLGVTGSVALTGAGGTLAGGQIASEFGAAVAMVGDVNGDGYDDALVGAPAFLASVSAEGRARLHYGSAAGPSATPGWTVTGGAPGQRWGSAVSGAGDMNRDGFADIAVGSFHDATNGVRAGRVAIYLGGPGGPSGTPAFELFGDAAGDSLGFALAAAGDVNGDRYDDLAIGAPGDSGARGSATIVYGGGTPPFTWARFGIGSLAGEGFGRALAGRGDMDADGYADVAVGAPRANYGVVNAGGVAVYRGGPSGLIGAGGQVRAGELPFDFFGASVSWGDLSGDGRSDLVVGAPGEDSTAANQGAVYAYVTAADGTLPAIASSKLITAQTNRLERGASVAANGDLNGDGFADIVFGMPGSLSGAGMVSFAAGGGVVNGRERIERMRTTDDAAPIALQGAAPAANLRLLARSAAGRQPVSVQTQAGSVTTPFAALPVLAAPWTLPGAPDPAAGSTLDVTQTVTASAGTSVRWRMRVKSRFPWTPYTPWLTPSGNAATLADFLTPGGPLSVEPAPAPAGGGLSLATPHPNPTRAGVGVTFALARASEVSVTVHDTAGRLVRRIARAHLPAGVARLAWDGTDARGAAAPAGLYFVRVATPDAAATRRFVRLQ